MDSLYFRIRVFQSWIRHEFSLDKIVKKCIHNTSKLIIVYIWNFFNIFLRKMRYIFWFTLYFIIVIFIIHHIVLYWYNHFDVSYKRSFWNGWLIQKEPLRKCQNDFVFLYSLFRPHSSVRGSGEVHRNILF